jgi:hypothetical protein
MQRKSTRVWLIPVLVALLLVVATAGVTFHHHANSNDTNCSVCHFSHQSADLQILGALFADLGVAGASTDIPAPDFIPAPSEQRLPARAPPLS